MVEAIRRFDWANTPLGPRSSWPPSLVTLVDLMLRAGQPMFMAWGPEQTWLYNDAFVPILGRKHPAALGLPASTVWSEAWEDLKPLFERVFSAESVHMNDISLMLDRRGALEEAHFSFSYTPVRGEEGKIAGLFGVCTETIRLGRKRRVAMMPMKFWRSRLGRWLSIWACRVVHMPTWTTMRTVLPSEETGRLPDHNLSWVTIAWQTSASWP
jgi:PAS fold